MTTPATAAELREALGAEYGQFVAVVDIDLHGARAFNKGDAVPASHVSGGVVTSDQVAKTTSKAAQAATKES